MATGPVGGEIKELRLKSVKASPDGSQSIDKVLSSTTPSMTPVFPSRRQSQGFQTRSILAVPLMDHDQMVGVLEIFNTAKAKQFEQSDLDLLTAFGSYASVALRNAALLATLRDESEMLRSRSRSGIRR